VTDQLGTKVKVRIYGIDAPETVKGSKRGQPHGFRGTGRKERKGLWQQKNPQQPWEFRKPLKKLNMTENHKTAMKSDYYR